MGLRAESALSRVLYQSWLIGGDEGDIVLILREVGVRLFAIPISQPLTILFFTPHH